MSEVRRFDRLERVVRDTRRQLDDHAATVLARLGTHTHPGMGGGGVTDHGALTGLGDDDHPQYLTLAEGNAAYQPLDSDLTTIAGLAPTDGSLMRRVSGAWSTATLAQVKTDLALGKADVGLGAVDNVSAADLRDRTTHTGTQAQSTVTNLVSDLAGKAPLSHSHNGDVVGETRYVRLTSDQTVTNSSALVTITGYSFTLSASATYIFDGWLIYTGTNTTTDFKIHMPTISGASLQLWTVFGVPDTATSRIGDQHTGAGAGGTQFTLSADAAGTPSCRPTGTVTTTTAQTLSFQFAQNAAAAATTAVVKAGSWLRCTRIA